MKFLRINFDDENTVLQKAIKKSLLEISEWLKELAKHVIFDWGFSIS